MPTAITPGTRVDQFSVDVTVDGTLLKPAWDTLSGGALDTNEQKIRTGGSEMEMSLGGTRQAGNVTVTRYFDRDRDASLISWLKARVNTPAGAVVWSKDNNGARYREVERHTGILKMINGPDPDANSNNAAMVSVEISTTA